MKRLALIMIGCAVMFSCGDTFIEDMETERLAVRQKEGLPSLVMTPTIISFTEGNDPVLNAAVIKVRLTAPPESEVILNISAITDRGLSVSTDEIIFTPGNYSDEQEITVGFNNDFLASFTRHYSVSLSPLESLDPLYSGMEAPVIEVTIFEDDFNPTMYPITPDPDETSIALYKQIKVQFDRAEMDTDSIIVNTTIKDENDNIVQFGTTFDPATKTATFTPFDYYNINTSYAVTMKKEIHDTYGNTLLNDWEWTFHTKEWAPALKCILNNPDGYYSEFCISGNYAYVTRYDEGLDIIDISNPQNPILVGNYVDAGSKYWGVAVVGNYAYLANNNKLQIIDITNKTSPTPISSCSTTIEAYNIQISGNHAFILGHASLESIDISNVNTPILKNKCSFVTSASDFYLLNKYIYVANESAGLQIVDISDPDTPTLAGICDTPGGAKGVYASGNYAYIADNNSVQIIDITDKDEPIIVGNTTEEIDATKIVISGNFAYTNPIGNRMYIINVSNPKNPKLISTYTQGNLYFERILIKGDYAYVNHAPPKGGGFSSG